MTYSFCTCFDSNYLLYGWTLYRSLVETGIKFRLYVACLDETVYRQLSMLNRSEIILIPLSAIEQDDPGYAACKNNRSRVEYIFTLSPVLPLYLFRHYPEIDVLGYLDSDLFFFRSPAPLFDRLGACSLLIVRHDFNRDDSDNERMNGIFNMAFQLYCNNPDGLRCLSRWREECIDWCRDYSENGKFADQKYLESWPKISPTLILGVKDKMGAAPWNLARYRTMHPSEIPFYFHYQGCKWIGGNMLQCDPAWISEISNRDSDFFFGRYYRELKKTQKDLNRKLTAFRICWNFQSVRGNSIQPESRNRRMFQLLRGLCNGKILFKGKRTLAIANRFRTFLKPKKQKDED